MLSPAAIYLFLLCGNQKAPFDITNGSKAPEIRASAWLKGTPVRFFEEGKVYVIDSWASWCSPCRKAMPHLDRLSRRYAGQAVFVGISVMEWSEDDAKKAARDFGDSVSYPLLRDSVPEGANMMMGGDFVQKWLIGAGRYSTGIPLTFVIDRSGTIAWIGHPKELDGPLDAIINGTWDLQSQKKKYDDSMRIAARTEPYKVEFYKANIAKDWASMDRNAKKVLELDPEGSASWVGQGFRAWALDAGNLSKALLFAREIRDAHPKHSAILAHLAENIYDLGAQADKALLDLAWVCIGDACGLRDLPYNDFVKAKGLVRRGEKSEAVQLLQKAIANEENTENRAEYQALLHRIANI